MKLEKPATSVRWMMKPLPKNSPQAVRILGIVSRTHDSGLALNAVGVGIDVCFVPETDVSKSGLASAPATIVPASRRDRRPGAAFSK